MKVKEIAQEVEFCYLNGNLKEIAGIMRRHEVDAVPVADEQDKIIGVITHASICQAVADYDRKASSIKVSQISHEEILICDAGEKFDKLLKKLSKKRVKYAGFISREGQAAALISLPNILLRFTDDKKLSKKVFRAMEKISRPLPLVLSEINPDSALN